VYLEYLILLLLSQRQRILQRFLEIHTHFWSFTPEGVAESPQLFLQRAHILFLHHHQPITVHCTDKGLSNFSLTRSIFSYFHPAPASRPAQIVTPPVLRPSYTTFTETQSPLQIRLHQRLLVLRLIWPAPCHFSVLIQCAMSVFSVGSPRFGFESAEKI
jgi:hypothetical protein